MIPIKKVVAILKRICNDCNKKSGGYYGQTQNEEFMDFLKRIRKMELRTCHINKCDRECQIQKEYLKLKARLNK